MVKLCTMTLLRPSTPNSAIARLRALKRLFELGFNDLGALEELNAALRGARGAAFVDLQCDVMERITALRAGAPAVAQGRPPGHAVLRAVLTDAGCAAPDGRPLHRYAVSDARYEAVRRTVADLGREGRLDQPAAEVAALFCIFVCEWYRREYAGGVYCWEDPAPETIKGLSYASRTSLARTGLAWWGRKAKRHAGAELRLVTLVLEGGFPTRLLETHEQGRIAAHLRQLTEKGELALDPDADDIARQSAALGVRLGHFNNSDFHALCADLVLAIVSLKRKARTDAPPGVPLSSFLDATSPNWRDELPVSLSGGGAARLIDELVSAKAQRVGRSEARCRRVLLRQGQDWVPGLRLGVDGLVDLGAAYVEELGRLRLHAAGALASLVAGELALLEPPNVDDVHWLCRGRSRAGAIAGLPFEAPVEVELRSGERRIGELLWPRGEPLRAEILAFVDSGDVAPSNQPRELVYIGGGSLRTTHGRVFLLTPRGTEVRTLNDDLGFAPIWKGDRWLFDVSSSVHVVVRDGRYRVDVAADAEGVTGLLLEGAGLPGAASLSAEIQMFAGTPRVLLRQGAKKSPAGLHQVSWRRPGGAVWKDWASAPPRAGLADLYWRDAEAGVLIDKARIMVTPPQARVVVEAAGAGASRYRLAEAPGWRLETLSGEPAAEDGLTVLGQGPPRRTEHIRLVCPSLTSLDIVCQALFSRGGFFGLDGVLVADNTRVMLEDLRGMIVAVNKPTPLWISGPSKQFRRILIEDQQSLWSISEDILRLLSRSENLDDVVRLELGDGGGRTLTVGRYATALRPVDGGVVCEPSKSPLSGTLRLERLSLVDLTRDVLAEGPAETLIGPTHTAPVIPAGPGILLLRRGDRVVGRPTLHVNPAALEPQGLCALQHAVLERDAAARVSAFGVHLEHLGEADEAAQANRRHLMALMKAREGVPASAFDTLRVLSDTPAGLAGLAAHAETDLEREKLWLLERELPFLWCLIPVSTWADAFDSRRAMLHAALLGSGFDESKSRMMARPAVESAAAAWIALDPLLASPLSLAGLSGPVTDAAETLTEPARDRIRRMADADGPVGRQDQMLVRDSIFRRKSGWADHLPDLSRFDASQWEGLDAAFAAALSAADIAHLDRDQVLRIRSARAEEPASFQDLYVSSLLRLARGKALEC